MFSKALRLRVQIRRCTAARTPSSLAVVLLIAGLGAPNEVVAQTLQCRPTEVIHADVRAMNGADARAKLAMFAESARVFSIPTEPHRLTGALSSILGTHEQRRDAFTSLASQPSENTEVMEVAEVGDLAIAKLRVTRSGGAGPYFLLAGFRVSGCQIVDLWHIARSDSDQDAAQHRSIMNRLVEANNSGDLEGFLSLFATDLLFFRNGDDRHAIGDRPSRWNGDPAGRRNAFAEMFANGAPGQASADPIFTVGDLVVSRDTIVLAGGKTLDEISIYRIGRGKITHDWLIAIEARP